MIYSILLDKTSIYGLTDDMVLKSPHLSVELNSAGTLDFTMPKDHRKYDAVELLKSDVDVYENDELIWFGRVISMSTDVNLNKTVKCEGPLAFFNDSVLRPESFPETTVHAYFARVIEIHNSQVPDNRQFEIGNVTVDNTDISASFNYDLTIDILRILLENVGGYFFFRKEEGINYIDWLAELPYQGTQPIQFGINLVDLKTEMKGESIRTAVIPLGAETDGVKLTISDINDGLDYIKSEAADTLGTIFEVVDFPEVLDAGKLMIEGQKWLENQNYAPFTIDCSAAELHYLDESYSPFKIGQKVKVYSEPHLINTELPLTSIDIDLDSAVKKITVGTIEKMKLTDLYKK